VRKLGCFALLLVLAAIALGFVGLQYWSGKGPLAHNITIEIAPRTSLAGASIQLEKAGAISSAQQFRLFAKILGSDAPIKVGEYRIPAHLSQADILKVLQGSKTLQRFVTIPEGWPSVMVQEALDKTPGLEGKVAVPVEGSILPDSYSFQRGNTKQFMVDRMQRAMVKYLADAWERRKPGLAVTTPREALILASIVEKETGKPDERRMVAAVYSNRLKRGMMLQADPTIIYPITRGKPLGRRILASEVHAVNGYNTYAMAGLPTGPICNPGRASIDAVLDPAQSNALYFVADGTGGHVFADTLEQHNINVQKWYAIRRSRGQM
jgi:UPF0755 protein